MRRHLWKPALLAAFCVLLLPAFLSAQAPSNDRPPEEASPAEPPPALEGRPTDLLPDLPPPANTIDRVRRRGALRVGVCAFVPWAMQEENGEWMGFEIDVARKLAEDLGVEARFVPASWPHILDDLLTERFDIIISGLSIDPRRALLVNFSIPYNHSEETVVAHRAKAGDAKTVQDLNRDGVVLGARSRTTAQKAAEHAFPQARLQTFEDDESLLQALLEGEVHAAVGSSPAPEIFAAGAPEALFLPLAEPLERHGEAFAIRKGDADFLSYLDTWIRYYEENGWLEDRRDFWFHSLEWQDRL